jgi:hypothetical protein
MIIWGSRGNMIDLGQHSTQYCAVCERERPFHLVLLYRYWHLYWIFCVVTKKTYTLQCSVCRRGSQLAASDVEKALPKQPIPFMHRMGLAIGVATVVLLVLVNTVFGA